MYLSCEDVLEHSVTNATNSTISLFFYETGG